MIDIFAVTCRVKEYIHMDLDMIIIDPDKGANIARKLDRLQKSGVSDEVHTNLRTSPELPKTGWTSNLAELPFVTFATLYQHFVEQPINTILMGDDAENSGSSEDFESDESKDEYIPSFRGLGKGYRFFKDGHVQCIEFHPLPARTDLCFVRAKILPSMVKNKKYAVRVCLTERGEVYTAYCVCPAGLAGCCNHIAALLYALEEFVRLGLREESRLPCTSRLQLWNRPRCRRIPPSRVLEVIAVKEEYGKQKRRKVRPIFDPRPTNLRVPKPEEQSDLLKALQKEHEEQLRSDTSGNVAKYGSSCLLKLMGPSSSESSSESEFGSDITSESDTEQEECIQTTSTPNIEMLTTPEEFYEKNVVLTKDKAVSLELETRGQSKTNSWFLARRIRVTASVAKNIAARRSEDYSPLVRRQLSCQFRGNKATRYGQHNEKAALDCFVQSLTLSKLNAIIEVKECGLVVDSSESWLGASPDAFITVDGEKCLVEIKCPYAARDMTVEDAVEKVKSFCLSKTETNGITLQSSHKYYYQIQVQLHVCKLNKCYFVVWTPKNMYCTTICIDSDFLKNIIPKLRKYYFQELLPALTTESV